MVSHNHLSGGGRALLPSLRWKPGVGDGGSSLYPLMST